MKADKTPQRTPVTASTVPREAEGENHQHYDVDDDH